MSRPHNKHSKKLSRILRVLANRKIRKTVHMVEEIALHHGHHDDKPDNYRANKPRFPADRERGRSR